MEKAEVRQDEFLSQLCYLKAVDSCDSNLSPLHSISSCVKVMSTLQDYMRIKYCSNIPGV